MDKERFLDEITDQISYKPLRPSIRQELSSHIEDRVEEYESLGLSASDAAAKALACMGDAVAIGTELNEIHRIQGSPLLSIVTALLFLTGFAAACSGGVDASAGSQWSPMLYSGGNPPCHNSLKRISPAHPLPQGPGLCHPLPVSGGPGP